MAKHPRSRKPSSKPRGLGARKSGPEPPALALPFVKLNEPHAHGKVLDYWAPPTIQGEDGLAEGFRGGIYARLAIQHMTRHPDEHPILLEIIGCMVAKGRFWATFDDDGVCVKHQDAVAIGFVGALADILGWADSAGLLRQQALSYATHLETRAEETRDKDLKRPALAAAEDLKAFALPKEAANV